MNRIFFLALFCLRGSVAQEESQALFLNEAPQSLPELPCVTFNGDQGICRLLAQCASFIAEVNEISETPCTITEGQEGICCPLNKPQTEDPGSEVEVIPETAPPVQLPPITTTEINDASQRGIQNQADKQQLQEELAANNTVAEVNSPAFLHARLFETTDEIVQGSKNAETILDATNNLKNDFSLSKEEAKGLSQIDAHDTILEDRCPTDPICPSPNYSYRTMDGSCNNLRHQDWGKTGIVFTRMIPADYQDGVQTIRLSSVSKQPLPSARLISAAISPSANDPYNNFTNLIWQWGQFVDHDVTHTPIAKGANKSVDVVCCRNGEKLPENELDPNCFPIDIPATDRFYSALNVPQICMDFVRSYPGIRPFCKFGPREQINQITSYIDASNVYGSDDHEMQSLRSFKNGKLKVFVQRGRDLLPENPTGSGCKRTTEHHCFLAGDTRVNEQTDLAVMHTVWMRQHNKIVDALAQTNPGWNDEILFQEGRRIVGAQMQHIIYNEYLPLVLGREYVEAYGLLPKKEGYYHGYRNDIDATIYNVFATAAFRYGHTLITDTLQGFNKFGNLDNELELSRTQFVPFDLYNPQVLDNLIRGLSFQRSQKFDRFFSEELTNLLFRGTERNFGMDLVALNIQRGRDHGLPAYPKWREACGLAPISDWITLGNVMSPGIVEGMKKIYETVDDIDIFIGAVVEDIVPNTLVGPTFQCLLGRQFIRLKIGDRFYYENGDDVQPSLSQFSEGQLQEIRKTTLARIFCDNGDDVTEMQPLAFLTPNKANKKVSCSDPAIPRVSLRPWANRPIWTK